MLIIQSITIPAVGYKIIWTDHVLMKSISNKLSPNQLITTAFTLHSRHIVAHSTARRGLITSLQLLLYNHKFLSSFDHLIATSAATVKMYCVRSMCLLVVIVLLYSSLVHCSTVNITLNATELASMK